MFENVKQKFGCFYKLRAGHFKYKCFHPILAPGFRTMAALKQFMSTGIPEAGLQPLDPMRLDNVELNLAGAVVSFNNVTAIGLSNHEARNVQYDRNTR